MSIDDVSKTTYFMRNIQSIYPESFYWINSRFQDEFETWDHLPVLIDFSTNKRTYHWNSLAPFMWNWEEFDDFKNQLPKLTQSLHEWKTKHTDLWIFVLARLPDGDLTNCTRQHVNNIIESYREDQGSNRSTVAQNLDLETIQRAIVGLFIGLPIVSGKGLDEIFQAFVHKYFISTVPENDAQDGEKLYSSGNWRLSLKKSTNTITSMSSIAMKSAGVRKDTDSFALAQLEELLLDNLLIEPRENKERTYGDGIKSCEAIAMYILRGHNTSVGYGGVVAGLILPLPNRVKGKDWKDVLDEAEHKIRNLSDQTAMAAVWNAAQSVQLRPPYDLCTWFLDALIHMQDWESVLVSKHGLVLYEYKRRYSERPARWFWERHKACDESCSIPSFVQNERGVLDWRDWDSGDKQESIWSSRVTPGLSSEQINRFSGISMRMAFPEGIEHPKADLDWANLVGESFAKQLDLLSMLVQRVNSRRSALRSAVSAIMGRNMSHNIGSHVLARYSTKIKDDTSVSSDTGDADPRGDFLAYLQRRMDYLAEVATSDKAFWTQPLSLRDQLARLNFDEQLKRYGSHHGGQEASNELRPSSNGRQWIAGSPILLSFITGKESLIASVEYGTPESVDGTDSLRNTRSTSYLPNEQEDFLFSCPGGEVGVHALYVILENIIRNSARHGSASADSVVRLFVKVIDAPEDNELLRVEIIDPRTQLASNGCLLKQDGTPKHSAEEIDNEVLKLGNEISLVSDGIRQKLLRLPAEITSIFASEPFLDENNSPCTQYWGLREMQICAHYLRGIPLSDLEGLHDDPRPVIGANSHNLSDGNCCLKYVIYMQRAKLMATVVKQRLQVTQSDDQLRCKGVLLIEASPKSHDDWKAIALQTVGYSFLALEEFEVPDDGGIRALLPVRTISLSPVTVKDVIGQALSDMGIAWTEPLNRLWAEQCRDKRGNEWHGKPIWGVAVKANQALRNPDLQLKPDRNDGLFSVDIGPVDVSLNKRNRNYPLPQEDAYLNWIEQLGSTIIAAVWIDHPKEDVLDLRRNASLAQAYRVVHNQVASRRCWISVEGAFSDSPHASYLNALPDTGWELLAAAIPRVAVLDERVQSEHDKELRGIGLGRIAWPAMGVWVPGKSECDLDSPTLESCHAFLTEPADRHDQYPIDFLILHLTVLERLSKSQDNSLSETLGYLVANTQARNSDIIIVTGRGVPSVASSVEKDHLDKVRYLPISALLESLVTRPSKLALMRAIWSAGRPRPVK